MNLRGHTSAGTVIPRCIKKLLFLAALLVVLVPSNVQALLPYRHSFSKPPLSSCQRERQRQSLLQGRQQRQRQHHNYHHPSREVAAGTVSKLSSSHHHDSCLSKATRRVWPILSKGQRQNYRAAMPLNALQDIHFPHSTSEESAIVTDREEIQVRTQTKEEPKQTSATSEVVPSTLPEALRLFFLDEYHGPRIVVAAIGWMMAWRFRLGLAAISALDIGTGSTTMVQQLASILPDIAVFSAVCIFWCFQEHVLHGQLLHSDFDWYGKQIHKEHHNRPYHHVSIDPAPLMVSWMAVACGIFYWILPSLPLALTACAAYAGAGLWYEWAHFIAHTRVRFPRRSYWRRIKDHHIRHHQVNSEYWLAFSAVPAIDNIFKTNPTVQRAVQEQRQIQH